MFIFHWWKLFRTVCHPQCCWAHRSSLTVSAAAVPVSSSADCWAVQEGPRSRCPRLKVKGHTGWQTRVNHRIFAQESLTTPVWPHSTFNDMQIKAFAYKSWVWKWLRKSVNRAECSWFWTGCDLVSVWCTWVVAGRLHVALVELRPVLQLVVLGPAEERGRRNPGSELLLPRWQRLARITESPHTRVGRFYKFLGMWEGNSSNTAVNDTELSVSDS